MDELATHNTDNTIPIPTHSTSTSPLLTTILSDMTASMSPLQLLYTTIKLVQQDTSLKRFSGEEQAYSASTLLQHCDDAMSNSNITTKPEKIAFVRSQLFLIPVTVVGCLQIVLMKHYCIITMQNFFTIFRKTLDLHEIWILFSGLFAWLRH